MDGKSNEDGRFEAGLELIVEFHEDRVDVFRISPLPRTSRLLMREPKLTEKNLPSLTPGLAEMVVATLDESGSVMEEFGFPVPGRRFYDFGSPEAGTLRGGPRAIPGGERDLRSLLIPMPARDSHYFFFYRTDVRAAGAELALQRRPVLLVASAEPAALPPQSLPYGLPQPRFVPSPTAPPWEARARPLPWMDLQALAGDGAIVNVVGDPGNGNPADRFDIVISGDGFDQSELGTFDSLALTLKQSLAAMEPFVSLGHLINWHVVRGESTDSGITSCPIVDGSVSPKRTLYRVEGGWENTGAAGFLGTHYPERIQWAAEHVAPWSQIELVVIIANCNVWGGHAWPAWKTAILTAPPFLYAELASHECAHVIAELAEEYIVCTKDNPLWPDHNKARLAEVGRSLARKLGWSGKPPAPQNDTIWWRQFAPLPGERNADGTFAAVLTVLDPVQSSDGISPDEHPNQRDFIGAFWGCQDAMTMAELQGLMAHASKFPELDLSALQTLLASMPAETFCDPFWDPRAALYFRPSAHCRMRHPKYRFCRVCQHLMANRLRLAAGVPALDPHP